MYSKSLLVWLLLMVLAILNGGLRDGFLVSRLGAAWGHVLSTVLLVGLIVATTWLTVSWMNPPDRAAALSLGGLWLGLTLAFEFGFGHFVAHKPWSELLADYNLFAGRVWLFVPLTVLLAPFVAARRRGFF